MRKNLIGLGALVALSLPALADDAVEAHLLAAKQAAGFEYTGALARTCIAPAYGVGTGGPRGVTPARETWHAEPAKIFDNLYFIGTKVHSAWALKGSDGIIVIDHRGNIDTMALIGKDLRETKNRSIRCIAFDSPLVNRRGFFCIEKRGTIAKTGDFNQGFHRSMN